MNALDQISIKCGHLTVKGFSRGGLATYVQIPELDLCFDMGECPQGKRAKIPKIF